jgi:hypothetical protein
MSENTNEPNGMAHPRCTLSAEQKAEQRRNAAWNTYIRTNPLNTLEEPEAYRFTSVNLGDFYHDEPKYTFVTREETYFDEETQQSVGTGNYIVGLSRCSPTDRYWRRYGQHEALHNLESDNGSFGLMVTHDELTEEVTTTVILGVDSEHQVETQLNTHTILQIMAYAYEVMLRMARPSSRTRKDSVTYGVHNVAYCISSYLSARYVFDRTDLPEETKNPGFDELTTAFWSDNSGNEVADNTVSEVVLLRMALLHWQEVFEQNLSGEFGSYPTLRQNWEQFVYGPQLAMEAFMGPNAPKPTDPIH